MNIPENMLRDLHRELQKVCPISGVSSDGRITFESSATESQQAAAQSVLKNFDTSVEAQTARDAARRKLPDQIEVARDMLNSDTVLTNAQISRLLKFMVNRLLPK